MLHDFTGNTLVVFLNDNEGPLYTGVQSNGPLRLGKLFLFEGGIRVHMLVKWPAMIEARQVFDGVLRVFRPAIWPRLFAPISESYRSLNFNPMSAARLRMCAT